MNTKTQNLRLKAWERLEEELKNPSEPLSISNYIVKRVLLTYGGPTVWIDFRFSLDESELLGATLTYTWGGAIERIELEGDEIERLANAYGLI